MYSSGNDCWDSKSESDFRRQSIRDGLDKLIPACTDMFLQMYPEGIAEIPSDNLDLALRQVENSLKKPHLLKGYGHE